MKIGDVVTLPMTYPWGASLRLPASVGRSEGVLTSRVAFLGALGLAGILVALCVLELSRWGRPERRGNHGRLRAGKVTVAIAALAGVAWGVFGTVQELAGAHRLAVATGFSRLSLAIDRHVEASAFLARQGFWAICATAVALGCWWFARCRREDAELSCWRHDWRLGSVLLAEGLFVSSCLWLSHRLQLYLSVGGMTGEVALRELVAMRPALDRALQLSFAATVLAAVLLLVGTTPGRSPARRGVVFPRLATAHKVWMSSVLLPSAAVLMLLTEPLAKENSQVLCGDCSIVHVASDVLPLGSGVPGVGPDALYRTDGTLWLGRQVTSSLRWSGASTPQDVRELLLKRHGSSGGEVASIDIGLDPTMSEARLREWLVSLHRWGMVRHVAAVMTELSTEERPILGRLTGARFTAARFELRDVPTACGAGVSPVIDLSWPGASAASDAAETLRSGHGDAANVLQRVVELRRVGRMPCVVVGEALGCETMESHHPDCWDRLDTPLEVRRRTSSGAVLRGIRVGWGTAEFDVVEVKDTRHLRLYQHDRRGRILGGFEALRRELATAGCELDVAMNAGMFHPGYAPVGLLVTNGTVIAPMNVEDGEGNFFLKPNGVFMVKGHKARIFSTANPKWFDRQGSTEFSDAMAALAKSVLAKDSGDSSSRVNATQSGPLLLEQGQEHPAFNPNSTHRAFRNGVGVRGDVVLLAISNTPVTFHEMSRLFTSLGCADALYLDGNLSSLDFPPLNRRVPEVRMGPMIAVVRCQK